MIVRGHDKNLEMPEQNLNVFGINDVIITTHFKRWSNMVSIIEDKHIKMNEKEYK